MEAIGVLFHTGSLGHVIHKYWNLIYLTGNWVKCVMQEILGASSGGFFGSYTSPRHLIYLADNWVTYSISRRALRFILLDII